MKKYIEKCVKWCLGVIYPRTCCFCGCLSKTEICFVCGEKLKYIKEPRCKKCGKPVRYKEQEVCYDCQKHTHFFEQGKSVWIHEGVVKWSIYQFKYHNRRMHGEFYAKEMCRLYRKWIQEQQIDVIVPVPLHRKKQKKRGYNQSFIVAKALGEYMQIPVDAGLVIRRDNTAPQKGLSTRERKKNLRNAFVLRKSISKEKNVLIVDDIYTTGSTIDNLAKVFVENGNKVWFLTISIGQGF